MLYPVYVNEKPILPPDLILSLLIGGLAYILTGNSKIAGTVFLISGLGQLLNYAEG